MTIITDMINCAVTQTYTKPAGVFNITPSKTNGCFLHIWCNISISVWSWKRQFVSPLVFSETKQKTTQWAEVSGKYVTFRTFIHRLYNMNAFDEWSVGEDAVTLRSTTCGHPVAPDNQPCRASIGVRTEITGCTFHPDTCGFPPIRLDLNSD